MPEYIAPEHLHNRAMRRWFAKYGPVSKTPLNEWPMARFGPTPTGWYWEGITNGKPLTTIVLRGGKVVGIR